jgi:hypothetical protein
MISKFNYIQFRFPYYRNMGRMSRRTVVNGVREAGAREIVLGRCAARYAYSIFMIGMGCYYEKHHEERVRMEPVTRFHSTAMTSWYACPHLSLHGKLRKLSQLENIHEEHKEEKKRRLHLRLRRPAQAGDRSPITSHARGAPPAEVGATGFPTGFVELKEHTML